jgi:hypothetical protein
MIRSEPRQAGSIDGRLGPVQRRLARSDGAFHCRGPAAIATGSAHSRRSRASLEAPLGDRWRPSSLTCAESLASSQQFPEQSQTAKACQALWVRWFNTIHRVSSSEREHPWADNETFECMIMPRSSSLKKLQRSKRLPSRERASAGA